MTKLKNRKFKKLSSKLFYTLSLSGIGLLLTQQNANAMFNGGKKTIVQPTTTTTTSSRLTSPLGTRPAPPQDSIAPLLSHTPYYRLVFGDKNKPSITPTTPFTPPQKPSTKYVSTLYVTLNNDGKPSSTPIITTTKISEKSKSDQSGKHSPTPKIDPLKLLNEFKNELRTTLESQSSVEQELLSGINTTKQKIIDATKQTATDLASYIKSTNLKSDFKSTLEIQSSIKQQVMSNFQDTKKGLLEGTKKSMRQGTLSLKQGISDSISYAIKNSQTKIDKALLKSSHSTSSDTSSKI